MNPILKKAMTKKIDIWKDRGFKSVFALSLIALVITLGAWANFINRHEFNWQSPVVLRKPLIVTEKKSNVHLVAQVNAEDLPLEILEPLTAKAQFKQMIDKEFGKDAETMKAIVEAESHYNPRAMGWNCKYKQGSKEISTSCKAEDRSKAWSVDCGLFQINVKGQACPESLLDPELNAQVAVAKYEKYGLTQWSSYNSGAHKQYIK